MSGRRYIAEPLVEGLVVELRQRSRPAVHLLSGDPFDAALDLGASVTVFGVQASPVLLQVLVGDQPGPDGVRQLDHLDAIRGHVLGAGVEPDAVGLLQGSGPAADVGSRVEHLELAVAEKVGCRQPGHTASQHGDVKPLHRVPSSCPLARRTRTVQSQKPPVRYGSKPGWA